MLQYLFSCNQLWQDHLLLDGHQGDGFHGEVLYVFEVVWSGGLHYLHKVLNSYAKAAILIVARLYRMHACVRCACGQYTGFFISACT